MSLGGGITVRIRRLGGGYLHGTPFRIGKGRNLILGIRRLERLKAQGDRSDLPPCTQDADRRLAVLSTADRQQAGEEGLSLPYERHIENASIPRSFLRVTVQQNRASPH